MNISKLLQMWKARRAGELSPGSVENATRMYERWESEWGSRRPEQVTALMVERYRLGRKTGQDALNRERSELKQFLEYCVDLGELQSTKALAPWKWKRVVVAREYVVLAREEEERLLRSLERQPEGEVLCRLVVFSIETGLRQGTIRNLAWEHVRGGDTLVVPGHIMKQKNSITIPLSSRAAAVLSPGQQPDPLMGRLPRPNLVRNRIRAAAKEAGLSAALTPHDFRRTFVARMRDRGASLADVMYLGGWTSMTRMLKHYFGEVPLERSRRLVEGQS